MEHGIKEKTMYLKIGTRKEIDGKRCFELNKESMEVVFIEDGLVLLVRAPSDGVLFMCAAENISYLVRKEYGPFD